MMKVRYAGRRIIKNKNFIETLIMSFQNNISENLLTFQQVCVILMLVETSTGERR